MAGAVRPGDARAGHKFRQGDQVLVMSLPVAGHVRTPHYLRGALGWIDQSLGAFPNPERLAYGDATTPLVRLFRVAFALADVFDDYQGVRGDVVTADLYEHWLQEVSPHDPRNRAG